MKHQVSQADRAFREAFEGFGVAPEDFDHRAHVRLAYVYLCEGDGDGATTAMKRAILSFLEHLGVGTTKYHETITRAWVMAVDHFMDAVDPCGSFEEFIVQAPRLLDKRIMLSHYSAEVLFSDEARAEYVDPDLAPIPRRSRR